MRWKKWYGLGTWALSPLQTLGHQAQPLRFEDLFGGGYLVVVGGVCGGVSKECESTKSHAVKVVRLCEK
jgi:hypothetical protein